MITNQQRNMWTHISLHRSWEWKFDSSIFGDPLCGDVPLGGLVVESLVSQSFRNWHKTPLLRMGSITFCQDVFVLRSAASSEWPGSMGPGPLAPWGLWARAPWTHGFHGPVGPWSQRIEWTPSFCLAPRPWTESVQGFCQEVQMEIDHGAQGISAMPFSMQQGTVFQENTPKVTKWAPQQSIIDQISSKIIEK